MRLPPDSRINKYLLLLIIFVAILLRCLFITEIPFTHDELSALFRTHFSSFADLIEKGVKPDGHPAGIQVFLYYWTNLFGTSEWVVKLPFIVFGILAVLFIYKIGNEWFNSTVGLVCAAFVSTLQYPVMYSQIARPYISGLFFVLIMVYYWHKIVTTPDYRFYINGFAYIIASTLCAYNHYFSLLLAAIIALTGIFIIKKEYITKYLLFCAAIFLTFLPHLGIFIHQLKLGGVEGWLGKPHGDFLINYVGYIFHFSGFVISLVGVIILTGLWKLNQKEFNYKYLLISFCWFILPFLVGFFYSKYVNAVLQYSVLIFSFPFLLFLIFGHLPEWSGKINALLVLTIILINTLSLVFERKHFSIFYKSAYQEILAVQDSLKKSNPDCISIIDTDPRISHYYTKKLQLDSSYIAFDNSKPLKDFVKQLKSINTNFLYYGCLSGSNPLLVPVIQESFPNLVWQKNYYGGCAYLFSKTKLKTTSMPIYHSLMNFEVELPSWSTGNKENWVESFSNQADHYYSMDSLQEWSPTFTINLKEINEDENNFIDISVYSLSEDIPKDVMLVSSLESKGKSIDWRATSFDTFYDSNLIQNGWIKVFHTIKLSDIYLSFPDIELKVYVWNKGKQNFFIDDFEIKVRRGNPIIYGVYEKVK